MATIHDSALAREEPAHGPALPPTGPARVLPERILMIAGPSNVHPRVRQALGAPLTGHKDPAFLAVMDDTADLLRMVFQTENAATFALPASGGSGMDAALLNLLEPGDTVVIGRAGYFANRMVGIAERIGAKVVVVDAPWGQAIDPERLIAALRESRARVVATVHGETSTGVEHPLHGLGRACRDADAFLIVDAVASLGGVPLPVDDLEIDVCFSGSQKCLSAPPGLAPITISDRAMEMIQRRKTPPVSWYLDLTLHARLWDKEHVYHHTTPVLSVYALYEALRIVAEEGLDERFARHRRHARALIAGLEALGLRLFADSAHRLASVTTVLTPRSVDAAAVRSALLQEYSIEIAGGLEIFASKMWRVGIMGHSATKANVMLLLGALEQALRRQGHTAGDPLAAADALYRT